MKKKQRLTVYTVRRGDTENEITTLCLPSYSAVVLPCRCIISFREKLLFGSAIMPGRLLGARTHSSFSLARVPIGAERKASTTFPALWPFFIVRFVLLLLFLLLLLLTYDRLCRVRGRTTRSAACPSEPTAR